MSRRKRPDAVSNNSYLEALLRRVLFEKVRHIGDCGLTGRFDRDRTSLPLKGD